MRFMVSESNYKAALLTRGFAVNDLNSIKKLACFATPCTYDVAREIAYLAVEEP